MHHWKVDSELGKPLKAPSRAERHNTDDPGTQADVIDHCPSYRVAAELEGGGLLK